MRHRVHNFLAEHLRTIQYPPETNFKAHRGAFRWTHDMPVTKRIGLAAFFLFLAIVLLGVVIILGTIGWAFIGVILGFH
jgi:hypothetical protein